MEFLEEGGEDNREGISGTVAEGMGHYGSSYDKPTMVNELTFLHLFVAVFAWARLASPIRASTLNAVTGIKDVMNKIGNHACFSKGPVPINSFQEGVDRLREREFSVMPRVFQYFTRDGLYFRLPPSFYVLEHGRSVR